MTITITHAKVSAVADTANTALVRPSDWNAAHVVVAPETFAIACSDETSALTAGTGKATLRMPYAFAVSSVKASLTTAQSSGSIVTVDVKNAGVSILGSLVTIDNGEKTSATAATAATVTSPSLSSDAEIAIDVTQVGDGTATGLKVYLIGSQ